MIMAKVCTACSIAVDEVELNAPFDGDKRSLDYDGVVTVSFTERCRSLEESTGFPDWTSASSVTSSPVSSDWPRVSSSALSAASSVASTRYRPLVSISVLRSLNDPVSYSVSPSANISWRRSAWRSTDLVDSTSISKAYRSPSNR